MLQNPGFGCHNSYRTSSPHRIKVLLGGRCMEYHHSRGLGKPKMDKGESEKESGHSKVYPTQPHTQTQSSLRCTISQPHAWIPYKLSLTASHPGFWQLEPVRIWLLSSPGQGEISQEPIHFLHPIATCTKVYSAKPILPRAHLPAPGSWSNSFCSNAISRAWDIFSRSSFGGNSDLGGMGRVTQLAHYPWPTAPTLPPVTSRGIEEVWSKWGRVGEVE